MYTEEQKKELLDLIDQEEFLMATRELCKCCYKFNPVGYNMPDEIWNKVVPEEFRNKVLCLTCFDYFATENGVDWTKHIEEVYFVSGAMHIKYEILEQENY